MSCHWCFYNRIQHFVNLTLSLWFQKNPQKTLPMFKTYFCCCFAGNNEGSCFSFLRFIDVSPAEMTNVMLRGILVRWVRERFNHEVWPNACVVASEFSFALHVWCLCICFRWLALFLSLKSSYRLYQQHLWAAGGDKAEAKSVFLGNKALILWLNSPTSFPSVRSSSVLQVRSSLYRLKGTGLPLFKYPVRTKRVIYRQNTLQSVTSIIV